MRPRVIPSLLLQGRKLIKTKQFKSSVYLGDPINAVKLFNDKEVDELVLFDIEKSKTHSEPDFAFIEEICSEAFMPICYGGGIKTTDQMRQLFNLGVEKISLSSALFENPQLIQEANALFGAQSIVVTLHTKLDFFNRIKPFNPSTKKIISDDIVSLIKRIESLGAGEIILYSVDRDGMMNGYDLKTISQATSDLKIPLVACGGAKTLDDCRAAIHAGASAVSAGSMFVFQGELNGVLINFPSQDELRRALNAQ